MACFHPIQAGRPGKGIPLVFGQKILPQHEKLKIACNQCIGCRLDHSLMWATRIMHETKSYQDSIFITLTYNQEHYPEDNSLSLDHWQLFMKRLRKTTNEKIKYFHCGEYSPKKTRPIGPFNPDYYMAEGQRPHYHAIIFNHTFSDKELWTMRNDIPLYTSIILDNLWGKGFATLGNVTFESAAYVARYALKKINGPLEQKIDEKTGLRPYERVCHYTGNITEVSKERVSMSNGIGKNFYNTYKSDMFPRDYVIINEHQAKVPRYYDKIYDVENPESMEEIKERRILSMRDHAKDNTPSRLAQREKVKQAQNNMLIRGLENE